MKLSYFSLLLLAVVSWQIASPSALAVTINLVYRGPGSASPDPRATTNPNDPNGALLAAHMQHAASDWSDIVEDSFTMTVNYFYAGAADVPTQTANANVDVQVAGGSRTQVGTIQFFDARAWWFDPTPTGDTEFDLEETLLGDLSPADQSAGFNQGVVGEPLLEVGYRGAFNGSDVSAGGGFDVLSTATHEIGHLMGVTSQLLVAQSETLDSDYDLPSSMLSGANVAAIVDPSTIAHLQAAAPLMSGQGVGQGIRRGISATDALAAAAVSGWTQIDLQRQDFLSLNTDFAAASNWEGNQVPGPTDFASIRHGGSVSLGANDVVGNLRVANGSRLSTGAFSLFTQGVATIGPQGGHGAPQVVANTGGSFTANNIEILAGELRLDGGAAGTQSGELTNNALISGDGTLRVGSSFSNAGTLRASGGTLVVEEFLPSNGATADLDGPVSTGVVEALSGSLEVDVANAAFFSGTMIIGAGRFVDLSDAWRLSFGDLTLDGSATQTAELRGGDLEIAGNVLVDRRGSLNVGVDVQNNGSISVPQSNDTLTFSNGATYSGGTHNGLGEHLYLDDLQFNNGALTVGAIEIDGPAMADIAGGTVSANTIETNGNLFIQSGGSLSFEEFNGKLEQTGGVLALLEATIDGSYTQSTLGELALEIGGAGAGESSLVKVIEDADLAGAVSVALVNGYIPPTGEQFVVLTADNVIATSLTLTGPSASMFQMFINGESIVLEAVAQFLEADFDEDGDVDGDDFLAWQGGFGTQTGAMKSDGDFDDDGDVDGDDFLGWQSQFGSGGASGIRFAVPEPSAFVLFAFAFAARVLWRRTPFYS